MKRLGELSGDGDIGRIREYAVRGVSLLPLVLGYAIAERERERQRK